RACPLQPCAPRAYVPHHLDQLRKGFPAMRIRGTLLAAAAISLLLVAGAQESAEAPIDVVERAMGQLAVSDYRFSYDLYPSVDATSRIRGEGEYDADTSSWHYTLQADPTDPGADQSKNGEWLVAGGMP